MPPSRSLPAHTLNPTALVEVHALMGAQVPAWMVTALPPRERPPEGLPTQRPGTPEEAAHHAQRIAAAAQEMGPALQALALLLERWDVNGGPSKDPWSVHLAAALCDLAECTAMWRATREDGLRLPNDADLPAILARVSAVAGRLAADAGTAVCAWASHDELGADRQRGPVRVPWGMV